MVISDEQDCNETISKHSDFGGFDRGEEQQRNGGGVSLLK